MNRMLLLLLMFTNVRFYPCHVLAPRLDSVYVRTNFPRLPYSFLVPQVRNVFRYCKHGYSIRHDYSISLFVHYPIFVSIGFQIFALMLCSSKSSRFFLTAVSSHPSRDSTIEPVNFSLCAKCTLFFLICSIRKRCSPLNTSPSDLPSPPKFSSFLQLLQ